MLARAFARSARLTRPTMMRRGGGGAPEVNEPGGYLFNEKVFSISTLTQCINHSPIDYHLDPCQGGMGKHLQLGHGRWFLPHGCCFVLQA